MVLKLPTYSRSAQNGSRRPVETAYEELCFASEDVENVLFVAFFERVHQQIARLREPAEENECFGRRECRKVCTSLSEHLPGELIYALRQLVAFACRDRNVERSNCFGF